MAGLGFKDFQVGEVLTAADVDGYLMQQSVMRFADSAARGSALGTAVGTGVPLAEGMVSYLDDVNSVQIYNGSGWTSPVPGMGSNVVQTIKSNGFTSSSLTYTPITGLSLSITPASNTNKVLVIVTLAVGASDNGAVVMANVKRDSTNIGQPSFGTTQGSMAISVTGNNRIHYGAVSILDSPATTSAITYSVDGLVSSGSWSVNRNQSSTDFGTVSTITAIEVAA